MTQEEAQRLIAALFEQSTTPGGDILASHELDLALESDGPEAIGVVCGQLVNLVSKIASIQSSRTGILPPDAIREALSLSWAEIERLARG